MLCNPVILLKIVMSSSGVQRRIDDDNEFCSKFKDFRNDIHSFPAWRLALKRDIVENNPASLLVVSLGKALNGMPPSLYGRQVAYPYLTRLQL